MQANARPRIRFHIRDFLVLIAAVVTSPLWLIAWLEAAMSNNDTAFKSCSEFLSLFPGRLGIFLRRGYYGMCLEAFATDSHIGFGTILAHPRARIGSGAYIGDRCTLGHVIIEDHATIGSNVDILSGRRQHHFDRFDVPIQHQGGIFSKVRIGKNTWIGNSSVIMADVGDDCVIGAGSVVVQPIPPYAVAVGNPAIVKRMRCDQEDGKLDLQRKNPAFRVREYTTK